MISLRPIIPFLLACASASAASTELVSELQGQTGLAVTIYNSDLALIKDRRRISLPSGITDLAIRADAPGNSPAAQHQPSRQAAGQRAELQF